MISRHWQSWPINANALKSCSTSFFMFPSLFHVCVWNCNMISVSFFCSQLCLKERSTWTTVYDLDNFSSLLRNSHSLSPPHFCSSPLPCSQSCACPLSSSLPFRIYRWNPSQLPSSFRDIELWSYILYPGSPRSLRHPNVFGRTSDL